MGNIITVIWHRQKPAGCRGEKDTAISALRLGFHSQAGQIGHRCDVSSELCCPDAKPRRWAPLVTRFGVIPRV